MNTPEQIEQESALIRPIPAGKYFAVAKPVLILLGLAWFAIMFAISKIFWP